MGDERPPEDLRVRTKKFALRIIKMCSALPETRSGRILGNQVFRSGTSVGANYREAYRARSRAEFISKMGESQKELEETIYWMELLAESSTVTLKKMTLLLREADELGLVAGIRSRVADHAVATMGAEEESLAVAHGRAIGEVFARTHRIDHRAGPLRV